MGVSKPLAGHTEDELRVRGPQAVAEAHGERVACPSCGATLMGKYCQDCGQERRDPADLSVQRVVGEAAREFVDLESGALGTLRDLLFRPGYLTTEYLEGRRQAHVGPAKLYVLVSDIAASRLRACRLAPRPER